MTYQTRLKQRHREQLARRNKKCNRAVSANVVVDGAAGSRTRSPPGSGAMWLYGPQAPQPADTCTCTERLHEAIAADDNDMIYAATREEVGVRRTKHRAALTACRKPATGSLASPV